MKKATFNDIHIIGKPIVENELYVQYHYPDMLNRYDSNFIDFKEMPTLAEFTQTVNYLRDFHKRYDQQHVKLTFPENKKPAVKLLSYLEANQFEYGHNELYMIEPNQFPIVDQHPQIEIKLVTETNIQDYLLLQYENDLPFGEKFAKDKTNLNEINFATNRIIQVIAYYKNVPAGSVDIIVSNPFVEIDNLFVIHKLQRKGIGSHLQQFVMNHYNDRPVILVADGMDTPREMYQKQNYQFCGFKYEALKVYE